MLVSPKQVRPAGSLRTRASAFRRSVLHFKRTVFTLFLTALSSAPGLTNPAGQTPGQTIFTVRTGPPDAQNLSGFTARQRRCLPYATPALSKRGAAITVAYQIIARTGGERVVGIQSDGRSAQFKPIIASFFAGADNATY